MVRRYVRELCFNLCFSVWRDGTFNEFQHTWSDQPVIPGYVEGGNDANYDKELDGIRVWTTYVKKQKKMNFLFVIRISQDKEESIERGRFWINYENVPYKSYF